MKQKESKIKNHIYDSVNRTNVNGQTVKGVNHTSPIFKFPKKRKIEITTGLGIYLLEGTTILSDAEIKECFDKNKFGIFVHDGKKVRRLDLE